MKYTLLICSCNEKISSCFVDHWILTDGVTAYHNQSDVLNEKGGSILIEPLEDATINGNRTILRRIDFESDKDLEQYAIDNYERKFDLITYNCEIFAREFIGCKASLSGSTQVNSYAALLLLLFLIFK